MLFYLLCMLVFTIKPTQSFVIGGDALVTYHRDKEKGRSIVVESPSDVYGITVVENPSLYIPSPIEIYVKEHGRNIKTGIIAPTEIPIHRLCTLRAIESETDAIPLDFTGWGVRREFPFKWNIVLHLDELSPR